MSVNEEFFSSIETEWQIESGNFKEEWTKLDLADIEPKLEKEWIFYSILIFIKSNFLKKYLFLIINPLTTGMDHFWSTSSLTPRLSAWPLHKIQNVTNVKFKSLALVFNSKFDRKLFSSLKIT